MFQGPLNIYSFYFLTSNIIFSKSKYHVILRYHVKVWFSVLIFITARRAIGTIFFYLYRLTKYENILLKTIMFLFPKKGILRFAISIKRPTFYICIKAVPVESRKTIVSLKLGNKCNWAEVGKSVIHARVRLYKVLHSKIIYYNPSFNRLEIYLN